MTKSEHIAKATELAEQAEARGPVESDAANRLALLALVHAQLAAVVD